MKKIFLDDSRQAMTLKEVCDWFGIETCEDIEEVAEEVIRRNDGIKTLHRLTCDGITVEC